MSKTAKKKYLKPKNKKIISDNEIKYESLNNKIDQVRENLIENYIQQKKLMNDLEELLKLNTKRTKSVKPSFDKYSGFDKLQVIPISLKKLLKIEEDSLPRSKITSLMYQYFTDNKMYNIKTKKEIVPNKQIKSIFSMEDNDVINFYNLQTWLKKLYDLNQ